MFGSVLSAAIVGAPLAMLIPIFLVRLAKRHNWGRVATLLTCCATF